ncbi:MAG TPA: c-type cytochrome, partial [Caulobacteraceae bacterium]
MTRVQLRHLLPAALAAALMGAVCIAGVGAAQSGPDAAHGKDLFVASCASCHGAGLSGGEFGPPLAGSSFVSHWQGKPPGSVASFIASRMPPSAAGTVSAADAADLEAYILHSGSVAANAPAERAPPANPAAPAAEPPTPMPGPVTIRDPGLKPATAARMAPLAKLTPVTDAMLRRPSDADWLMWRRTYQTLGFSPLRQINKTNVKTLGQAWAWSLPASQNEITPLVHDGVMFVQSGDTVQALGAVKGDLLWQYVR